MKKEYVSHRAAPFAAAALAAALAAVLVAVLSLQRHAHAPDDHLLYTYFVSASDATWEPVDPRKQIYALSFDIGAAAEYTSVVAPRHDGMRHAAVLSSRLLMVGGSGRKDRVFRRHRIRIAPRPPSPGIRQKQMAGDLWMGKLFNGGSPPQDWAVLDQGSGSDQGSDQGTLAALRWFGGHGKVALKETAVVHSAASSSAL
jgi:hypothetical protein